MEIRASERILAGMAEANGADGTSDTLVAALELILGGSRDPALADSLENPTDRAVVACVLEHANAEPR
jgi:hypothetical protein